MLGDEGAAAIKWVIKWSTVNMWTLIEKKKTLYTSTLHLSISTHYSLIVGMGPPQIPRWNRHLLCFKWITLQNEHDYGLIAKSIPC